MRRLGRGGRRAIMRATLFVLIAWVLLGVVPPSPLRHPVAKFKLLVRFSHVISMERVPEQPELPISMQLTLALFYSSRSLNGGLS
jgi:hypothetical protein